MNNKALKFPRSNISNYPENTNTATDNFIKEIINTTTQTSVNKIDEVKVMQCMLNDKDFKIAIYDRSKGYVGSRSPRDNAISLAVDTLSGVTGMSAKEARLLVEDYEFTKKDAQRFVDISKDFIGTYMQSGRKIGIVNDARSDITIGLKYVEEHDKSVPDKETGNIKIIKTPEKLKLSVTSKR